jgi:predicted dehydrogenase
MKKKILIVGVGQIGSRHLQGILKYNLESLVIHVVEKSVEALQIAKERASEVDTRFHETYYHQNFDEILEPIFLCILATSANVRENLVFDLFSKFQIRYLILEKVLFQKLDSYSRVKELLKQKEVRAWVNHPRRMYDSYKDLKSVITGSKFHNSYQVAGVNWGLACNAVHFIDLITFLEGSNLSNIDTKQIDDIVFQSKRADYIEFTGTITGSLILVQSQ